MFSYCFYKFVDAVIWVLELLADSTERQSGKYRQFKK